MIGAQVAVAEGRPRSQLVTVARRRSFDRGITATAYKKPDSESNLRGSKSKAVSLITQKPVPKRCLLCPGKGKKERERERNISEIEVKLGIAEIVPNTVSNEK